MKPPRAIHCEFPLGRPLGKPCDAAYQRRVLDAAFGLLGAERGPVLEDFGEEIEDAAERPLDVEVPAYDAGADGSAVAETGALRAGYDRHLRTYGRTNVGRVADADGMADVVRSFEAVAAGTDWKDVGFPRGNVLEASKDLMSYFEEAAVGLYGDVPEARQAESWFFRKTETGKLLRRAQDTMREGEVPFWFYVTPATQQM